MSTVHPRDGLPDTPGVEYRYIPGYPECYCAGNDGSIWSRLVRGNKRRWHNGAWHRQSTSPGKRGYCKTTLRRDGKPYTELVQRVVAAAFIGPCPDGHECHHRNECRTDNQADNLIWRSPSEKLHNSSTAPDRPPPFPETISVEYRHIPGYPEYYCVGSDGSVWTCRQQGRRKTNCMGKWRRRKISLCHGYPAVSMRYRNGYRPIQIHTLIAAAFLGPCPEGQECMHLDNNPANPAASNLAYGTHAENMGAMKQHGRSAAGSKHGNHVLVESQIPEIRQRLAAGESRVSIACSLGVSARTIGDISARKTWNHVP